MSNKKSSGLDKARESILKKSEEIKGPKIEGYDFDKKLDYSSLLDSFASTGIQASNLSTAIDIVNEMIKTDSYKYLGYTSNMVTSGIREIIKYLAKNKKVDVLVTTVGGIEEDIIKCFGDFILGNFRADGKTLRKKGVNRAGNIFVPNSRYVKFEEFLLPILEDFYKRQKETGQILTPTELIKKIGEKINNPDSIYYWCWKNDIPVFCPAIGDGSLGDMLYFFRSNHEDFKLNIMEDIWDLNNTSSGRKKTGMIILGSGVIKHAICNANLYRNGADYAVYINTSPEYDGSDSGALPEEAISWGKIGLEGKSVKVFGDASILFPLIVSKTFAK